MQRDGFSLSQSLTAWCSQILAAGGIALALGACGAGDATAPAPDDAGVSLSRGPTGQACVQCPVVSSHILFAAWRGSRRNDIYSMNPDGTGRKVIVASHADEFDPAWSPDGAHLVFSRNETGGQGAALNGLWTVGFDGMGQVRITQDAGDRGASWGKTNRIAFHSTRLTQATGTDEIFTVKPDGTGLTRLTNTLAEDHNPAWSPDGSRIVFASDRAMRGRGTMHLWMMNADGTGLTQLTFGTGEDQPAWSPDGTRIAYAATTAGLPNALWVMNADGTNAKAVLVGFVPAPNGWLEFHPGQPTWSPDSKRIAYSSDESGQYQLYSIAATGGAGAWLGSVGQETMPAWSN
jgi:Tol biopolymer transport system component